MNTGVWGAVCVSAIAPINGFLYMTKYSIFLRYMQIYIPGHKDPGPPVITYPSFELSVLRLGHGSQFNLDSYGLAAPVDLERYAVAYQMFVE
jgi:hypothetical protein